jgi:hypothetical protein
MKNYAVVVLVGLVISFAIPSIAQQTNALVAAFTKMEPIVVHIIYPGLNMESFAEFAKAVWTSFPDLHVELLKAGEIEAGVGATHWLVSDTNTGPGADGSSPTGRTVSFNGASIIQLEGDKLRSETPTLTRR